jgi:hypothetical protein
LLTPFHKLKGFEKRVERPGPSNRQNGSAELAEETEEASSIAKAAQAMQKMAQNRPTTKLLDAESLPRLDAPTAPFQRLGIPLKRPAPPGSDEQENKRRRRKTKRPLPGKRWMKANSRKESLLDGMLAKASSIFSAFWLYCLFYAHGKCSLFSYLLPLCIKILHWTYHVWFPHLQMTMLERQLLQHQFLRSKMKL